MNIPKPNLKAAKARAGAATARLDEILSRHKAEMDPAQQELWAAHADVRRQEELIRLTKIAADSPEVLAALRSNNPDVCPNGVARGLTRRTHLYAAGQKWTDIGERLVSLVAELSGVAP